MVLNTPNFGIRLGGSGSYYYRTPYYNSYYYPGSSSSWYYNYGFPRRTYSTYSPRRFKRELTLEEAEMLGEREDDFEEGNDHERKRREVQEEEEAVEDVPEAPEEEVGVSHVLLITDILTLMASRFVQLYSYCCLLSGQSGHSL